MRKRILIVNFLVLSALTLGINFMFSPVDTHAQSPQGFDQQSDRIAPLAAPTGDVRAGRGTYFAVVNPAGEVLRGTDVVSVTHPENGHFRVNFSADLSKCAFTATIMGDRFGAVPAGPTQVADSIDPRQVHVFTLNGEGFQSDRGFHLIVNCS